DVFYIGGTKCGAMFGEAVVITNDTLKKNFRIYMKQNGAVLAKGWLMGLQFETLLKDGTYLAIAKQADEYALRLQDVFKKKSIPLYVESPTNQQFVLLTDDQMDALKDRFVFEVEGKADESHTLVRFCTSWSTKESEMDALIEAIEAL
ncbi:MAG TPA: low specificity L-threonine aldolase, partial [Lachnospiraceae bacterium]|nr:low specificity L-threonine aldolase [Lachnospiraceae bacterium]